MSAAAGGRGGVGGAWRRRRQRRLLRGAGAVSGAVYEALAREATDVVLVTDVAGTVRFASPAVVRALGVRPEDLLGRDCFDWIDPRDASAVRARIAGAVAGSTAAGEHRILTSAGTRWVEVRFSDARAVPGVGGLVWNCRDVTRAREQADALRAAAHTDALTGLTNRRRLVQLVAEAATATGPLRRDLGLVLLNLDGLKLVNDSLGHRCGDEVVRTAARRLRPLLGPADVLARLDGDEFVLLHRAAVQQDPRDPQRPGEGAADRLRREVDRLAARALQEVARPVVLQGRPTVVTASAGTAVAPAAGTGTPDGEEVASALLRGADVALREAKQRGGARAVAFRPGLREAASQREALAADLRSAVERGQVHVEYQPQVDLATGRTVGLEALARWHHPVRGLVPPGVFVPVAEETGSVLGVGRHVLARALRDLRHLDAATGRTDLEVGVNVSGRQLADPSLVDAVLAELRAAGTAPHRLVLEVTESALVTDLDAGSDVLRRLREHGVRVALDDFGTGWSSLSYLRRLPVDVLKIDKSFVDDHGDRAAAALLGGIASLSTALDLLTVAEGVEDEAAAAAVRAAGCGWGQGYLWARPMPLERVVDHLLAEAAGTAGGAPRPGAQNRLERTTTA
ncbi:putative bifunctional diguanylate cyclase/phosphodiesterase [Kineococcus sp. SYSU DK004]|uniref:putative bifunctional diguanylate cyclase/phosphodiesterase n=1 Tax=Kineococcus sp. SYSU DK004 TaxID=3383125 RepID=UPI003D7EF78E